MPNKHTFEINPKVTDCKYWGYVLKNDNYPLVLNRGDSIIIKQTTTINDGQPNSRIDAIIHRFYNICAPKLNYPISPISKGKFYCYVDSDKALPTIGKIDYGPIPIHVAFPRCPEFGTITSFIWDTPDCVKQNELTEYEYVYEGTTPISFKTIEYYVTIYHGR